MPTGYTAELCKGEQSFEEFFLTIARAFCHIELRDKPLGPIPLTPYKPSDYRVQSLTEAKDELKRLQTLSKEDTEAEAEASYNERLRSYEESVEETAQIRGRLEAMLVKVNDWEPPTERHIQFKEFMVQQLTDTIKYDGCTYLSAPKRETAEEWLSNQIDAQESHIMHSKKAIAEERERTADNNKWITDLVESIGLRIEEREEINA